jgi:hypothetical protein
MFSSNKKFLNFSSSICCINRRYKLHDPKAVMILEAVLTAYADKTFAENFLQESRDIY